MMTSKEEKELIGSFERQFKVRFKNKKLLITALSHSSYAHENNLASNERLEFLGDSVLGLIVSERLYNDSASGEGKLSQMRSRIVSEEPLAELSKVKGFYRFLLLGVGEKKSEPSKSMIADGVEAIIGAIYLDQGIKQAKKFVLSNFGQIITSTENIKETTDAKSLLQEKYYKSGVRYTTNEIGMMHDPVFVSKVYVGGKFAGEGRGQNKRTAEKAAAAAALEKFENKGKLTNNQKTKKVKNK